MSKDTKFMCCCYSYMESEDWATDYEVLTDGLSSEAAFAASLNKGEIKKDLNTIVRITLDLNPMIRKRDKKIISILKKEISDLYEKYKTDFNTFFLPIGSLDATSISRLRMLTKQIIRLIFKNDQSQRELLDIFHILTNLFHNMYLQVTETKVVFKSKSYKL